MSETKWTPSPWRFERYEGYDTLHKLQGTTPEDHEGYFRSNGGDWFVGGGDGRVCAVDFKGKAKRGQGYNAPDPEGMANAHLIASAPELYGALEAALVYFHNDQIPDAAHDEHSPSHMGMVRQMRAALAKASAGEREG